MNINTGLNFVFSFRIGNIYVCYGIFINEQINIDEFPPIPGSSSSGSDSEEEGGQQEDEAPVDQENEEGNEEKEEEGGEEIDAPSASNDAHPASDTEDNNPLPENLPHDLTLVGDGHYFGDSSSLGLMEDSN